MNKFKTSENTTSEQTDINTVKSSLIEMNRESLYLWGASRKIMEIIRNRNKIPETRRLVQRREMLAIPGTLHRRHNPQSQRTKFAPSRPNKRSREESAEFDAELTHRANRIGGGYQSIEIIEEEEEPAAPEEGDV